MRRRPRTSGALAAAGWAVLLLMVTSCVAAVPRAWAADEPGDVGAERLAELTKIQTLAETARALRFKKPPVYARLRQDEVAPRFHQELLEDFDESELNDLLLAYEKLGLIPSSEGLLEDLVQAYAGEVIAFYDQDTDTVHLIGDLKVPAVMQRVAELHELVHALQDQHFDLGTLPLKSKLTDPSTAVMALVEGDAMLATLEYARGHAQLALSDLLETALGAASDAPAMPYLFLRETAFVYRNGFDFAKALRRRGGWAALGGAFASPPASTEQVLHYREKYIETRDEPTPVELPDVGATLGDRWRLAADDVLGELYVQTLFRLHLSALRAGTPSRGWDGDRMHLYLATAPDGASEDGDDAPGDGDGMSGDAYVLVWSTVWDSERDAGEFAEAYLRVVRRKLGADKTAAEGGGNAERDGPAVTIQGKDNASGGLTSPIAFIVSDGTRVVTVEGRPESAARAVLRALSEDAPTERGGEPQESQ